MIRLFMEIKKKNELSLSLSLFFFENPVFFLLKFDKEILFGSL